jgi:hypothetical protein
VLPAGHIERIKKVTRTSNLKRGFSIQLPESRDAKNSRIVLRLIFELFHQTAFIGILHKAYNVVYAYLLHDVYPVIPNSVFAKE